MRQKNTKYFQNTKTVLGFFFILLTLIFVFVEMQKIQEIRSRAAPSQATTHDIVIRKVNNKNVFFNQKTNATFVPRGFVYTRLEKLVTPFSNQTPIIVHANFIPDRYNQVQSEQALTEMEKSGYNVTRVLIDAGFVGKSQKSGLSTEYLKNVGSFLSLAQKHHIYVIIELSYIPEQGGYYSAPSSNFEGDNWHYLTPQALLAKQKYVKDFIKGLKNVRAPLSTIFAYSIQGEQIFSKTLKPMSLVAGNVETIAGTFDMSSNDQKLDMLRKNLIAWSNQVRKSILEEDPGALITISYYPPDVPSYFGNTSAIALPHIIAANPEAGGSQIDFLALSLYPSWGKSISYLMTNLNFPANTTKPLIINEMGVLHDQAHVEASKATLEFTQWQVESCKYGIQGWIGWSWDTIEQKSLQQEDWWLGVDSNGAIQKALSPKSRQNPCNP